MRQNWPLHSYSRPCARAGPRTPSSVRGRGAGAKGAGVTWGVEGMPSEVALNGATGRPPVPVAPSLLRNQAIGCVLVRPSYSRPVRWTRRSLLQLMQTSEPLRLLIVGEFSPPLLTEPVKPSDCVLNPIVYPAENARADSY